MKEHFALINQHANPELVSPPLKDEDTKQGSTQAKGVLSVIQVSQDHDMSTFLKQTKLKYGHQISKDSHDANWNCTLKINIRIWRQLPILMLVPFVDVATPYLHISLSLTV